MNWEVTGWTFLILLLLLSGFFLSFATGEWLDKRFGQGTQYIFWTILVFALISLGVGVLSAKAPQSLTPEQACKVIKPQEKLK
jgi:hypothetical protein